MKTTADLGKFLRSRRARLTPEAVGLVSYGTRRVPGLRREELAQLAGISATYYTRLEQGKSIAASRSVIDSLARALRLDADETAHLQQLARADERPRPRRRRAPRADADTVRLIMAMRDVPTVLLDHRTDVLCWNPIAHRLLAGHIGFEDPAHPSRRPNLNRLLFLDPHTRELHRDWREEATRSVASLRQAAGRHPDDRPLEELVGELSVNSPEFASLWASHTVRRCVSGLKHLHHPEVGDLDLHFQALQLPDDSGHRLLTHLAAEGSASAAALTLLAPREGVVG